MMKIAVAIFVGILALTNSSPAKKSNIEIRQTNDINDFCVTRECIETSYRFLKFMNQSADPCDDFYQVLFCLNYKLNFNIFLFNPIACFYPIPILNNFGAKLYD